MARTKRSRHGRPPGLRDIAERLGVSIGTVDRALHNRPEISVPTRASERGIPLLYVNTDAPGTERLPVTGHLGTVEHARKLEGFRTALATLWPEVEVADVVEGHEDERETYEKCRQRLARDREVAGVYVSTVNTPPVVRALRDEGLAGRVTVIATDLYPALAPLIESGIVAATIDQRPWVQGQMAFQTLYRYLAYGVVPPPAVGLSPHVVMRSNLKLLLERLRSTSESGPDPAPAAAQSTMPLPSTKRR